MLLKMQKEFLDTSGSEFVLINKVGVGAVNGLISCQVAGCPGTRRGPAEYRTDRTPPPKLSPVADPVTATAESCCPYGALRIFLGEVASGQPCPALAPDLQSDVSWDDGRGITWGGWLKVVEGAPEESAGSGNQK